MSDSDQVIERVWFTVNTRDAEQAVQAYLYSHTAIIARAEDDMGSKHFLLETTVTFSEEREPVSRPALRLAQYQADRLSSGLHGVSTVSDSKDAAVHAHYERRGVWLSNAASPVQVQNEASTRLDLAQHAASVITSGRTILAQGYYQAAVGANLATVAVLAVSSSPSDSLKPYSVHWAIYEPSRGWYASDGEYDLDWEEASTALAERH